MSTRHHDPDNDSLATRATSSLLHLGLPALYLSADLLDLALFRSLPHLLKKTLYAEGRWTVRRVAGADGDKSTRYLPSSSLKFARVFLSQMHLAGDAPRFKFIHLGLPYTPVVLDQDCRYLGGPQDLLSLRLGSAVDLCVEDRC